MIVLLSATKIFFLGKVIFFSLAKGSIGDEKVFLRFKKCSFFVQIYSKTIVKSTTTYCSRFNCLHIVISRTVICKILAVVF
jgi:hypothetical protein